MNEWMNEWIKQNEIETTVVSMTIYKDEDFCLHLFTHKHAQTHKHIYPVHTPT